jgi:hypothetical protein
MKRLLVPIAAALLAPPCLASDLRLGLVGTDTSHVIAFTEAFNGPPGPDHVEGAREIARLAAEAGVPWFSSSSLRWSEIVTTLRGEDTLGVSTWGPGPTEPHHHLDLSWYAIHPIEMLFALMGTGCLEATRSPSESGDRTAEGL